MYAAFSDGHRVSTLRDISCTGVPAPLATDTVPKPANKAAENIEKLPVNVFEFIIPPDSEMLLSILRLWDEKKIAEFMTGTIQSGILRYLIMSHPTGDIDHLLGDGSMQINSQQNFRITAQGIE